MLTETPLKKLREARGFTQAEVATAVDIDQGTLSKLEAGSHMPRKETAEALVKYYGSATTRVRFAMFSRLTHDLGNHI